jgi:hypothetical protein
MYHEFATDPKVQMLSEANQRRFIMLLCLRCSNDGETLHDEEIAFQLRISNDDFAQTKADLMDRGLIDEDCQPVAWEKRQFASDSSTERVRKYREQQKVKKKRNSNVSVTPPDTDTDTDTDTDNNPLNPPSGEPDNPKPDKPDPQKKPRARKTKLPDEFELTEHRTKLAVNYWASKGRWDLSVEDQFFKFRNHHTAKGSTMADWDAAWQTWYSNAVEFTKPTGGQPHAAGQRIDNSAAGRVRANIARERAQEDREAQGANLVGADVIDVWPQMD